MENRKIHNPYFPKRVDWHIKIAIGSALTAVVFNLIQSGEAFNDRLLYLFIIVLIQIEIAIWVSVRIFGPDPDVVSKNYSRTTLKKLLIVYSIVFGVASIIFISMVFFDVIINEAEFKDIVSSAFTEGLRTFIISASVGLLMGAVIFFYMQWLDSLKREQKLTEEKLIFQYETLKNQVNPHFLFNSLNTLSSLVYKDPKLSDEFIKKLADIYRYILENSERDMVDLHSEIQFIRDFFYLQKIRDNGKIELKIEIEDQEEFRILPISLQLLVENALKHNAATMEKPLIIAIRKEEDSIVISNNLQPKLNIEKSQKIGLKNLAERVKLMTGKEIEITKSDEQYTVKVPLIRV